MAIPNRGPELQVAGSILVSSAIIATLLRCYVRIFKVKRFGFDDWAMVSATATFSLFVTCALVGVYYGTGRHHWDLDPEDVETAMKYWWLCYIWYCLTMVGSKVSIGYFLLRITVRRMDIWIITGVMLVTVLTGTVFFFLTIFQCHPVSYFWNRDQNGSCINVEVIIAMTYLYSACSVICDFTFALLPIALIWKLNMNKSSKWALVPIMAMACVASAAVIVRFPFIKDFKSTDFLYDTIDIAIWSTTEQGLAITAGSLATLRPLLSSFWRFIGRSTHRHTELDDNDHPLPPTIGHISSPKASKGSFGMTTFGNTTYNQTTYSPDDDGLNLYPKGGYHSHDISAAKRTSTWEGKGELKNESEEELTSDKSDRHHHQDRNVVKVQTVVTVSEDRV